MTVAEKLLEMQKQLLEITNIPDQIQETIALVTKALEQYLPLTEEDCQTKTEFEERANNTESSYDENDKEECEETEDQEVEAEEEYFEIDEESTKESLEFEEDHFKNEDDYIKDEEPEDPHETYRYHLEQSEIEKMKQQKQQKIQTLERSWQKLCGAEKKVYKISQLNERQLISFYDRKRSPTMDRN